MVRKINGLPSQIQDYMVRALMGALDYTMTNIQPGGEEFQDFTELPLEMYGDKIGEVMLQKLSDKGYEPQLIEQVGNAVKEQLINTEGPDFESFTTLPSLVLLEDTAVFDVMTGVRDSIVEGVALVVSDLKLERRYQQAAMRAMEDGMRRVSEQFSGFMADDSKGGKDDEFGFGTGEYFYWEPVEFKKAVCCMPGMDCWSGDFANKAGRQSLLDDLERFQG